MINKYGVIVRDWKWIWHCLCLSREKGFGRVWGSVILNSLLSQWGDILWDQMLLGLATERRLGSSRKALKTGITKEACECDLSLTVFIHNMTSYVKIRSPELKVDTAESWCGAGIFLQRWIDLIPPGGAAPWYHLLRIIIDGSEDDFLTHHITCLKCTIILITCQGLIKYERWEFY